MQTIVSYVYSQNQIKLEIFIFAENKVKSKLVWSWAYCGTQLHYIPPGHKPRRLWSDVIKSKCILRETLRLSVTVSVFLLIIYIFFYRLGTINNKTFFHLWLSEFLQGPGASYRKDVRVKNGTSPLPEITVRMFSSIQCILRMWLSQLQITRVTVLSPVVFDFSSFPPSKWNMKNVLVNGLCDRTIQRIYRNNG